MDEDFSLFPLFVQEAATHSEALVRALLVLESRFDQRQLESAMRAAHSIKGAASIVCLGAAVRAAHLLEDFFETAIATQQPLWPDAVDICLKTVDYLKEGSKLLPSEHAAFLENNEPLPKSIEEALISYTQALASRTAPLPQAPDPNIGPAVTIPLEIKQFELLPQGERSFGAVNQHLMRLMMLSAESLIQSKHLRTFGIKFMQLKAQQQRLEEIVTQVQEQISDLPEHSALRATVQEAKTRSEVTLSLLSQHIQTHEVITEKLGWLSSSTYQGIVASQMRPFSDIAEGLPRMVRDLARRLNKKVRLNIVGARTLVDRDIFEVLESPFGHIIRNAIDHGIEAPHIRAEKGKPETGTLTLHARHHAGRLVIEISDDGKGIDLAWIRKRIQDRGLVHPEILPSLCEKELLEFLYLPGFSSQETITEFSGRGMGLNSVQDVVQRMGGLLRISTRPPNGSVFQLQFPITRAIVRSLITVVESEPYAFPLNRIYCVARVPDSNCKQGPHGRYFDHEGQNVPLIDIARVWNPKREPIGASCYNVIITQDKDLLYGMIVDSIIEERELVVQPLDARLGRVPNLNATALMPDGPPVILFDMDDLVQSMSHIEEGHRPPSEEEASKPRILIVDDSITVRQNEEKILQLSGYSTDTAINGVDAWNALQLSHYDLVVSDIDMPRLNGLELLKRIREDPQLFATPVILVSYKDRDHDIEAGKKAGANFYLVKNQDLNTELVRCVHELVDGCAQKGAAGGKGRVP